MAETAIPRILLVDDDSDVVRLVQHVLTSSGYGPAVQVATGGDALASLSGIDIVLLDHQLPDTSGLDVLTAIRAQPQPPGVILVTAHGNESLAAAALRLGADDYLAKDTALPELLPQIIERVRRNRELRKALAAAEQDLMRAVRLTAIGEMTVTLHHEINNPLMAAFADVELLLAEPGAESEQRRLGLENIRYALRRIRDIVQRIGGLREARTKDYLRGIRMLDLNREESTGRSSDRGLALIHLADEDLIRIVSLLLRDSGFQIRRVESLGELTAEAESIGVSLVVLAGGATTPGAHPLSGFEPPRSRDYLVVALVTGGETAALAAGADQVVHLPFDPRHFTADILRRQAATVHGKMG
jgi:DNA-binding response OmpR family regulator